MKQNQIRYPPNRTHYLEKLNRMKMLTQNPQTLNHIMTTTRPIWKLLNPSPPHKKLSLKIPLLSQNQAQSAHVLLLHRHQTTNIHQLNSLKHHKTKLRILHLHSSLRPLKPVKSPSLHRQLHHKLHQINQKDRDRKKFLERAKHRRKTPQTFD